MRERPTKKAKLKLGMEWFTFFRHQKYTLYTRHLQSSWISTEYLKKVWITQINFKICNTNIQSPLVRIRQLRNHLNSLDAQFTINTKCGGKIRTRYEKLSPECIICWEPVWILNEASQKPTQQQQQHHQCQQCFFFIFLLFVCACFFVVYDLLIMTNPWDLIRMVDSFSGSFVLSVSLII